MEEVASVIATLMPGIDSARNSNGGLYTLRTPAPMLLPMRHQCGTAADDPRYYDRPGNAQPEHTRNRAHNGVNAKRPAPHLIYNIGFAADTSLPAGLQRLART